MKKNLNPLHVKKKKSDVTAIMAIFFNTNCGG